MHCVKQHQMRPGLQVKVRNKKIIFISLIHDYLFEFFSKLFFDLNLWGNQSSVNFILFTLSLFGGFEFLSEIISFSPLVLAGSQSQRLGRFYFPFKLSMIEETQSCHLC